MADEEPSEKDVICGRGRGKWLSPGNQHLAELIRKHSQRYEEGTSKTEKSRVVETLFSSLKRKGTRFMKLDESSGNWFEMDDKVARCKVSHAIRDYIKNDTIKQQQQQQEQQSVILADDNSTDPQRRAAVSSRKRPRDQKPSGNKIDANETSDNGDKKMPAIPASAPAKHSRTNVSVTTGNDNQHSAQLFPGVPLHLQHAQFNLAQNISFPQYSLPYHHHHHDHQHQHHLQHHPIEMQISSQGQRNVAGLLESASAAFDIMEKSSTTGQEALLHAQGKSAVPSGQQARKELQRPGKRPETAIDDKPSADAAGKVRCGTDKNGTPAGTGIQSNTCRIHLFPGAQSPRDEVCVVANVAAQRSPTISSQIGHLDSMNHVQGATFVNDIVDFSNIMPIQNWPVTSRHDRVYSPRPGDLPPLANQQHHDQVSIMQSIASQVAGPEEPTFRNHEATSIYGPHQNHSHFEGATPLLLHSGAPLDHNDIDWPAGTGHAIDLELSQLSPCSVDNDFFEPIAIFPPDHQPPSR
jgi:hypothetical protein